MLLLLPFDRRVDWKRPPLITLGLILLNCAVFFLLQSGDDAKLNTAYTYYADCRLADVEFPLYSAYLHRQDRLAELHEFDEQYELVDGKIIYAYPTLPLTLEFDHGFISALTNDELITAADPRYADWRTERAEYQRLLDSSFIHRYALRPAHATPVTVLSHMFLHGDLWHLLGNMVFLFIVGFVVETILGRRWYLGLYLAAGICAALLDIALRPDELNYHIGASGAVSGIMGAYAVLFGLRRIAFFYNILFWFDRITAPAIIMLPLWLANELLQLLINTNSNVNYLAHIGGLIGGALFTLAAKHYDRQIDIAYIDAPQKEAARRELLAQAQRLLAELKPQQAKPILAKLLRETPDDIELLTHLYHASRFQPDSEDYHRYARQLLALGGLPMAERLRLFDEYSRLAQPAPRFETIEALNLARCFLAGGRIKPAEQLVLAVLRRDRQHGELPAMLLLLARQGEKERAAAYLRTVITHFPAAEEARIARTMLELG
ncbi:MAG: rhomboid family intramembrane serine protease [Pseudomonadota bacterium]